MSADTLQIVVCVVLVLVGLVVTGTAWRRGRRGRVVQGLGLVVAPVALYLSGLLRIVLDFVAAILDWTVRVVFSPMVWTGLALLALSVVLLVVGGVIAGRGAARAKLDRKSAREAARSERSEGVGQRRPGGQPAMTSGRSGGSAQPAQQEVDPELDEIEALLKSRGIE